MVHLQLAFLFNLLKWYEKEITVSVLLLKSILLLDYRLRLHIFPTQVDIAFYVYKFSGRKTNKF